jgi:heme/copper-type cytochrome/quinol oxidase subunit 2
VINLNTILNILFFIAFITFLLSITYFVSSAKELRKGKKEADTLKVKEFDKKGIILISSSIIIFIISYLLGLL